MILANVRGRLQPADLQLMILLLSRGSAARRAVLERRLETEGPDTLLDTPDLAERMLAIRTIMVPSESLFFYVMVRHALQQSGIDDRDLADYLAALLLEFGRRDRAQRVDWHDDHSHRYLIDILADLVSIGTLMANTDPLPSFDRTVSEWLSSRDSRSTIDRPRPNPAASDVLDVLPR